MIIYPAIDLCKGRCIRLYQGDYQRETVYSLDPFAIVSKFIDEGATWLHVVDLDGAKNPLQHQRDLISDLIKQNKINVQTGGGIRSKDQVQQLLDCGASRVIVGSMAVNNKEEVAEWFTSFGADRLVLALDIKFNADNAPMVAVNAWQETSQHALVDLIAYYQTVGLTHLLCTNIALDGTLNGPDYDLYNLLLQQFPLLQLQASGGIHALSDVTRLRDNKLSGAVIGRALYENKFSVREVLAC